MNKQNYKESISEELLNRIKIFLKNNKDDLLDYKTCIEGYKLASQAFEELFSSREEFHKEYDVIMENFVTGINISIEDYNKNIETINKLNNLISRMEEDKEVHSLIKQLYSKKYQ